MRLRCRMLPTRRTAGEWRGTGHWPCKLKLLAPAAGADHVLPQMIHEHRTNPLLTTPSTNAATTKLVRRMATGIVAPKFAGKTGRPCTEAGFLGRRGLIMLASPRQCGGQPPRSRLINRHLQEHGHTRHDFYMQVWTSASEGKAFRWGVQACTRRAEREAQRTWGTGTQGTWQTINQAEARPNNECRTAEARGV